MLKVASINFFASAHEVAPQLIGCEFLVNGVGGVIVEVEAYDQSEPASHTYVGKTPRNAAMFGAPGCAYVYRSYGIHWCLNFVCGPEGHGAGVLIRAIQPSHGLEVMRERRRVEAVKLLCSGPGRVGQALAIVHGMNGLPLSRNPFQLLPASKYTEVVSGPRIGISKAVDLPWRFGLVGSPFLSKPFH